MRLHAVPVWGRWPAGRCPIWPAARLRRPSWEMRNWAPRLRTWVSKTTFCTSCGGMTLCPGCCCHPARPLRVSSLNSLKLTQGYIVTERIDHMLTPFVRIDFLSFWLACAIRLKCSTLEPTPTSALLLRRCQGVAERCGAKGTASITQAATREAETEISISGSKYMEPLGSVEQQQTR